MSGRWFLVGTYFVAVSAVLCLVLTHAMIRLACRWGILDQPHERGHHQQPVPLLGGVAIVVSVTAIVWAHLFAAASFQDNDKLLSLLPPQFHGYLASLQVTGQRMLIVFSGGLAMTLLGLWDDLKSLSVRTRIYPQFLIAGAVVFLGIRPELGFLPVWLSCAVAIVWLVGVTNAFNFIDGADGLAGGIAAICSFILGVMMILNERIGTGMFFFALGGACLGFLVFNWHPARIFMGSTGSLFLGYMLGSATMFSTFMTEHNSWLFPLAIPVLVFAVPLYDTATVILIRLGMKRSVFLGDRSHFHHRLMRIGFSQRQTVAFLYLLTGAFGLGALLISRAEYLPSAVVLVQGVVFVGLIVLMERVVSNVQGKQEAQRSPPVECEVAPGKNRELP